MDLESMVGTILRYQLLVGQIRDQEWCLDMRKVVTKNERGKECKWMQTEYGWKKCGCPFILES